MSFDDKTRLLRATFLYIVFKRGLTIVIGCYRDLTLDAYVVSAVGVLIYVANFSLYGLIDLNLCFQV